MTVASVLTTPSHRRVPAPLASRAGRVCDSLSKCTADGQGNTIDPLFNTTGIAV